MSSDLPFAGAALISLSIIGGGILIGAEMFRIAIPFAPYLLVILALLIVVGAAAIILAIRRQDAGVAEP